MIDMNSETAELVEHDAGGGENAADFSAAFEAWEIECARVEALRLKYASDAEVWRPAAPNEPPISRPSWLSQALALEARSRDKELALAEAEQIRRGRCDVSRGEFEDLLALLGLPVKSAVDANRAAAAKAHLDWVNRRDHPADLPYTPEEQRRRDEQLERSRAEMVERLAKNEVRFNEQEARRAGRDGSPRGTLAGTGREGFTRR
jgi:hypothetical protein